MKLLLLAAVSYCCYCAPVPLEEDFNLPGFHVKHENHEEKFARVDANQDKKLDFNEFLHMELAYVDAKREEFNSLDKDKDGIVTQKEYEEHYHGVTSRSEARKTEYFAKVFQDFDEDFDMSLNQKEMERVLAERFLVKPRENFPALFYSFDHDHSGGLDLMEYMKFDAEFPFDQTDPITTVPEEEQRPNVAVQTSSAVPPVKEGPKPLNQLDGQDVRAIAMVMAQGSPILSKDLASAASDPEDSLPDEGSGPRPVKPGPTRQSLPIVKLVKAARAI
ncbi:unnamed protein product [Cylicocyclus nassatus]|uniref:EF-hand domain-containing protein n=1 Tax=Cylicocyclus nassatus TaxID=53992 RepID=A0AA36ME78_CYLNA|nr:unnamed protein product [Cylicocyclus nassatus]